MRAAGIRVRALARQIPQTLDAAFGVEYELRRASVEIFAAQLEKICVFVKIYGELPAVDLAGDLVGNFYDYAVRHDLIDFSFLIFCFIVSDSFDLICHR